MYEHFSGEIELVSNQPQADAFSDFENLPNRKLISTLAEKHKDIMELMPYQREGESVKLLVNVYLKKPESNGRTIVILVREEYPRDVEGLRILVQAAHTRLGSAAMLKEQFDSESIELAVNGLEQLAEIIN